MKYKNNKFVNHLTRGTIAFTLLFGASTVTFRSNLGSLSRPILGEIFLNIPR
jgi:hypothetical protein